MNASEKLEAERLAGFYEVDEDEKGNYSLLSEYENKLAAVKRGINTDWLAQPLQNEFNHTHSLAIQGGTDNLRFNVDLNYDKQRGVMKESFRERMGGGFYVDYRIKGLQLKNQISYEVVKSENSPYGSFSEYTKMLPYDTFKDGEGNYVESVTAWHSGMSTKNPLYEAVTLNNYDKTRIQDLTDNLSINWYLTNTLYFKGQVAVTMSETEVKTFKDITKLERNGMFVYESVPGTAVNDFSVSDTDVTFRVEGTEDAQITVQLEDDMEYEVFEDGVAVGGMVTNMSGKLSLSVELSEGKSVEVRIVRK